MGQIEGEGREGKGKVHCWILDFCDSLTTNCWSSALSLSESLEMSSWPDCRFEERSMAGR